MECEWTYTTTKYNLEDWYIIWRIFLLLQVLSKSKVLYILALETVLEHTEWTNVGMRGDGLNMSIQYTWG